MKRALYIFVGLAAVIVALAAAVYGFRTWKAHLSKRDASVTSASAPDGPAPGSSAGAAASDATPRGSVTIDARRQQLIGVKTVRVTRGSLAQTIRAVGVIRYDETRWADVNLKVDGWIRDLYVDYTGQFVQKGQPLFSLYSPALLTTEHEYLLALKTRDQFRLSAILDARERADQLVISARQRLTLWDLSAEDLRTLDEKRQAPQAVVFRSPVTGFVIEKHALKGVHVVAGQSLYTVADLSVVWLEADLYETELSGIRVGVTAGVTIDAYPGERFRGRVVYIYPYMDEKTRTNTVRFELVNRRSRLKPGMYAHVELPSGGGMGLIVPTNAVLDSGTEQIVFVAQGGGIFEPRPVKIGRRLGDAIQILEGVNEGDEVATGATFFLDSESQLRAALQGYAAATSTAASAAASALDITLRTNPDPPKTGENQLEVTVKDAGGKPIDDADVTVQFFMPAMPTMNMPPMRSEAKLSPVGGGVYRGTAHVKMAGRWETTVTVTRGGQRLATKQVPVVAK